MLVDHPLVNNSPSPPLPPPSLTTLTIPFSTFERTLHGIAVASKASASDTTNLIAYARALALATPYHSSQHLPQPQPEPQPIALAHLSPSTPLAPTLPEHRPLTHLAFAISALRHATTHPTGYPEWTPFLWSLISSSLLSLSLPSTSTPTTPPRFQFTTIRSAQGFIAIPLCSLISTTGDLQELVRVHVWLPDGARGRSEVATHAHQCWGAGWILCGEGWDVGVVDCGEEEEDGEDAGSEEGEVLAEYALKWDGGKGYKTHQKSSTVVNTGRVRRVRPRERVRHTRGMFYAVEAGRFHRTYVEGGGLHATLFFFDASKGFEREAPVLGPRDGVEYTHVREDPGIGVEGLVKLVDVMRVLEERVEVERKGVVKNCCERVGVVELDGELMVSES